MILTHVCRSIAIAGHRGDVETVVNGLDHEAAEVRTVALGAAARLDILDHNRLRTALADPAAEVRYRAVELVARVPFGSELASLVVDNMSNATSDPQLREVSAFVLGELPLEGEVRAKAIAALVHQAGSDDDPLCRESAVAALGALGDGLDAILAATTDVATVRRRAVLALAPFDGPEVDAALKNALDDRDWQVRQAAEDLLA